MSSTYEPETYVGAIPIPETNTTTVTEWVSGPGGLKFFTKRWIPEGGDQATKVFLIFHHGFVEHCQRYNHVFPVFANKGIQVFAYDARGFGETSYQTQPKANSQGKTSWKHQLADLDFFVKREVDRVKEATEGKGKVILMGHSMGGGLVLAYATRSPPTAHFSSLSAIVSSAPLIRQSPGVAQPLILMKVASVIGSLAPNLQFKTGDDKPPKEIKKGEFEKSWRSDICRDKDVVKNYELDPMCAPWGTYKGVSDMLLGGASILSRNYVHFPKKLPVLIVHGSGDLVTHHKSSEELIEKLKKNGCESAEIKIFDEFYHELHNEPGDDKWTAIDFVSEWVLSKKDEPALTEKTGAKL